jgi:O-antigen chain-terminating methyltransferase
VSRPDDPRTDPVSKDVEVAASLADPTRLPASTRAAAVKGLLLRLLRVYSSGQVSFNHAAVRVLAALDARVQALQRLQADTLALQQGAAAQIADLAAQTARLAARIADLETHLQRLAREGGDLVRRVDGISPATPEQVFAPGAHAEFEKQFRGSREEILERQRIYVPILEKAARQTGSGARFLDLGCGRGELLELAKEAGLAMAGVESDEALVEDGRARGLDVRPGDLFDALWAELEKSLAGVTGIQVVEHLPWAAVRTLVDLAYQRIRPGGCLIVETINPASAYAMRAFYLDPTHRQPVPSEMTHFLFSQAGFRDVEVRELNPVDDPSLLAAIERSPELRIFADLIFGFRDYAAIGWKR